MFFTQESFYKTEPVSYSAFLMNKGANEVEAVERNRSAKSTPHKFIEVDADIEFTGANGKVQKIHKGGYLDITNAGSINGIDKDEFAAKYKTVLNPREVITSAFNHAVDKAEPIRERMQPSNEQVMRGVESINKYYARFMENMAKSRPAIANEARCNKVAERLNGVMPSASDYSIGQPMYSMG